MLNRVNTARSGFSSREFLGVLIVIIILICVGSIFVFRDYSDSAPDRVKIDLRTLDKACTAYRQKFGSYPPKLEELVAGTKPYLEGGQEAILDPWSQQYQYDLNGPRNSGEKPDIFTVDPDNGKTIGNWQ